MELYNDFFKVKHNNLHPQKGNILIAEPFLKQIWFRRAVILLVEHNDFGSLGITLNIKTKQTVDEYFSGLEETPRIPVYWGGPVDGHCLFFIHSLGDMIPNNIKISDDLYFGGNMFALGEYLISGEPIRENVKFFIGHAGWEANQLFNEIKQNSWIVGRSPSNRKIMLAEGDSFWKDSVKSVGGRYMPWINYPTVPTLN